MDRISQKVLAWYDVHARQLPWRIPPEESKNGVLPDPYHVWLSEVMLQQTTVVTVKPYFENFITRWPQLEDLAAAQTEEVMGAWAGLGYYSRARNLKACADFLAKEKNGKFPSTKAELEKLPGVGDYTSSAIASIAFAQAAPVVDGNIERVISRLSADPTPLPAFKKICRKHMETITPHDRPGDFAQAMMDLGATICTPKSPNCAACPLQDDCRAREQGNPLQFPNKPKKKAKPTRKGACFVIQRSDGAIWLQNRPPTGLLGGMAQVPTTDWSSRVDGATGSDAAPFPANWQRHETARHTFTHFHLELEVWSTMSNHTLESGWWSTPDQIGGEALPTAIKKVILSAIPDAF